MHELLTPAEMAEADRRTIAAGTPGMTLMECAGKAVADAAPDQHRAGVRVLVICGPGNNGGDGFITARLLAERGYQVRVMLLGPIEALTGDAATAASRWTGEIEAVDASTIGNFSVIVDALFGGGLKRPLTGAAREAVEAINRAGENGASILAVDLPSGIDGATGQVKGAAVHANKTITFCRKKPGYLLLPGRLYAGTVQVTDIGIADDTIAGLGVKTFENRPPLWLPSFPVPRVDGHKYARGHAVVASGPMHMTGAARLAARAALRAGAGLVTVAGPKDAIPVLAASLTAVMVRQTNDAAALRRLLADGRLNAMLLGPGQGVGSRTKNMVMAAAKAKRALVLDADALTSFAGQASGLAKVLTSCSAIVTPHEGEFQRLFSRQPKILALESKIEKARAAAKFLGAVVLLKGADTVVAAPDGRAAVADNAPPWLATAGTGDVLAGFVLGLVAQQMPAFEAACAGVWLHGECGREGGLGLIAEDLPETLPGVLRKLLASKI